MARQVSLEHTIFTFVERRKLFWVDNIHLKIQEISVSWLILMPVKLLQQSVSCSIQVSTTK